MFFALPLLQALILLARPSPVDTPAVSIIHIPTFTKSHEEVFSTSLAVLPPVPLPIVTPSSFIHLEALSSIPSPSGTPLCFSTDVYPSPVDPSTLAWVDFLSYLIIWLLIASVSIIGLVLLKFAYAACRSTTKSGSDAMTRAWVVTLPSLQPVLKTLSSPITTHLFGEALRKLELMTSLYLIINAATISLLYPFLDDILSLSPISRTRFSTPLRDISFSLPNTSRYIPSSTFPVTPIGVVEGPSAMPRCAVVKLLTFERINFIFPTLALFLWRPRIFTFPITFPSNLSQFLILRVASLSLGSTTLGSAPPASPPARYLPPSLRDADGESSVPPRSLTGIMIAAELADHSPPPPPPVSALVTERRRILCTIPIVQHHLESNNPRSALVAPKPVPAPAYPPISPPAKNIRTPNGSAASKYAPVNHTTVSATLTIPATPSSSTPSSSSSTGSSSSRYAPSQRPSSDDVDELKDDARVTKKGRNATRTEYDGCGKRGKQIQRKKK